MITKIYLGAMSFIDLSVVYSLEMNTLQYLAANVVFEQFLSRDHIL